MGRNITINTNDLIVYINGDVFGVASGLEYEMSYDRRPIRGIDSLFPFELAPAGGMLSGSISCFRLHSDAGLEGRGIAARDYRISRERYFSLQIVDRITDEVILQSDACAVSTQRWSLDTHNVVRGSFSFQGIGWSNEWAID